MAIKVQASSLNHLRAYQFLEILNRNRFEPYNPVGLEVVVIGGVAAVKERSLLRSFLV